VKAVLTIDTTALMLAAVVRKKEMVVLLVGVERMTMLRMGRYTSPSANFVNSW
jgi:hypothetical protein